MRLNKAQKKAMRKARTFEKVTYRWLKEYPEQAQLSSERLHDESARLLKRCREVGL